MGEWKEYKLGDVVLFKNGKSRPAEEGAVPIYGGNGILGYTNQFNSENKVVVIGRVGAYCGSVYFENKPIWISDNALFGLPKNNNDIRFLFYFLKNLQLNHLAEGSSHPLLTQNLLNSIDVEIPDDIQEQKSIASILSSLDDKIDLLHRQNKTLEALAETLFRQWFVEEAEEGWETSRLGDILESIESGSRPKGGIDPSLKEGIPSIGAENIKGLGVYDFSKTKFITPDFFKSMTRGLIKDYDVLIYKDGAYVGRKGMFADGFPYDICAVNEHVFILRANNRANQFFLYFLLQEDELAQLNANSAQPGLNQEAMKSLEIIIPPLKLINQFEEKVKSLIDKIFFNCNQIRTLTRLRDTLLPKLMSGEVRVKDIVV